MANSIDWKSLRENAFYVLICTVLTMFSNYQNILIDNDINISPFLRAFVTSIIPGTILGFLFGVVQACHNKLEKDEEALRAYKTDLENIINDNNENIDLFKDNLVEKFESLSSLIEDHKKEVKNGYEILSRIENSFEHYREIQNLLSKDGKRRGLIKKYLSDLNGKPYFIDRANRAQFYELLIEGLKLCESWQGIHQGSITMLCHNKVDSRGKEYFKILQHQSNVKEKKRIIILTEDDEQDLYNRNIMSEFWKTTGKYVDSFWIKEKHFQDFLTEENKFSQGENIVVHDCALHDNIVLLHYNRDVYKTVTGSDGNVLEKLGLIMIDFDRSEHLIWKIVKKLFERLNDPYKREVYFKQITKEYIEEECSTTIED